MLSDTKGWAGVTGQGLGDIRGSVWQDRDWRVRSSARCLEHIHVPLACCCRTQ